jgi:hypothetical protein
MTFGTFQDSRTPETFAPDCQAGVESNSRDRDRDRDSRKSLVLPGLRFLLVVAIVADLFPDRLADWLDDRVALGLLDVLAHLLHNR